MLSLFLKWPERKMSIFQMQYFFEREPLPNAGVSSTIYVSKLTVLVLSAPHSALGKHGDSARKSSTDIPVNISGCAGHWTCVLSFGSPGLFREMDLHFIGRNCLFYLYLCFDVVAMEKSLRLVTVGCCRIRITLDLDLDCSNIGDCV